MRRNNLVYASGGIMVVAFTISLVATSSSIWLWRQTYNFSGLDVIVSTGNFVASSLRIGSQHYDVIERNITFTTQRNAFDAFNSTLCSDFYEQVGRFGWCKDDGDDTEPHTPFSIMCLQTLTVASTVFTFFASLLALTMPIEPGSAYAWYPCFLVWFAVATTFGAIYTATESSYYRSLTAKHHRHNHSAQDGGYVPIIDSDGYLHVLGPIELKYGPSFYMFFVEFMLSVVTGMVMCWMASEIQADESEADDPEPPHQGGYHSISSHDDDSNPFY